MIDVREKPKLVERAYLIGIRTPEETAAQAEYLLAELRDLVGTLGIGIVDEELVRIREPRARYLLGVGKAEEIKAAASDLGCDCLVFDTELSPAQQRNWESLTGLCVIDRQEIILDIFNKRARTKEAVLQVELARAEHSLPRLKNAWTHLSRQRGGGVAQRGEGEAQIELDGRMVRHRIARLKRELADVVRHREVQRKQRQRAPIPTAAIVGYTNAGKSTLLNALTGANVLAADKLFATLDPTTRAIILPNGQKMLLTDTVGFVRRLPHRLVEAFRATLEEALVADFLIHVIDGSHPEANQHLETTLKVLSELGAEDKRILTVYNKMDCFAGGEEQPLWPSRVPAAFSIRARTGEGLMDLQEGMIRMLEDGIEVCKLLIPHSRYDVIDQLHRAGAVRHEEPREAGVFVVANLPPRLRGAVNGYLLERT